MRRGTRLLGIELRQFEIHAQLLKLAVAGGELIPELFLRILRGRLQLGDLCRERIDGLGGGRVLFECGFRRGLKVLDLGPQRFDLSQEVRIRLGGIGGDDDDFRVWGRGWHKGFDGPETVALGLEFVGFCCGQGDLLFTT